LTKSNHVQYNRYHLQKKITPWCTSLGTGHQRRYRTKGWYPFA